MNNFLTSQKILLVLFLLVAFNLYYGLYFFSFDQGATGSNYVLNLLKIFSVVSLYVYFFKSKITFNSYDLLFLWSSLFLLTIFVANGLMYGFNDKLFLNYIVFVLLYPFLSSKDYSKAIYSSYSVLSFIICLQILLDIIIKIFLKSRLWNEDVFVGGMGNPSSFAFICLFSIIYLLLGQNQIKSIKYIMVTGLSLGILQTSALFIIILMLVFFVYMLVRKRKWYYQILILCLVFGGAKPFKELVMNYSPLLKSKIVSTLSFFSGSIGNQSDSVYLRLQNYELISGMGRTFDQHFFLGHFSNINYYSVDSQYITWGLSFGFIALFIFLLFLAVSGWRILLLKNEKKEFLFIVFMLFVLVFTNNRILDYFPVGYIFITILALVSRSKLKRKNIYIT